MACLGALAAVSLFLACNGENQPSSLQEPDVAKQGASHVPGAEDLSIALQPWKGDYDGMVERRRVRILVPYSMTLNFAEDTLEAVAEEELVPSTNLLIALIRVAEKYPLSAFR